MVCDSSQIVGWGGGVTGNGTLAAGVGSAGRRHSYPVRSPVPPIRSGRSGCLAISTETKKPAKVHSGGHNFQSFGGHSRQRWASSSQRERRQSRRTRWTSSPQRVRRQAAARAGHRAPSACGGKAAARAGRPVLRTCGIAQKQKNLVCASELDSARGSDFVTHIF